VENRVFGFNLKLNGVLRHQKLTIERAWSLRF
jgi:hypothetical protein